MYDIQKASLLKRISAFLLDFILMSIAVTGFALLISVITGFQGHLDTLTERQTYYEELHGVDFNIDEAAFNKLSEEDQEKINTAYDQFARDKDVLFAYNMAFNLTLVITSLSLFFAYLLLEFIIPLFLKNGQTVGKKVFNIGIVHHDSIRLTNLALFARTVLGKYTIETMIPVIIIVMMLFGAGGFVGVIVLGLILVLEIFVFFKDKLNTPIHDVIGHTICVDLSTQMIFENADEMIKYKQKIHAEEAERADYF